MPCAGRVNRPALTLWQPARRSHLWFCAEMVVRFQFSWVALWLPKIASGLAQLPRWATLIAGLIDLLKLLGGLLVGVFRSHAARQAETAFLRHQLVVLRRSEPARLRMPMARSRRLTAAPYVIT